MILSLTGCKICSHIGGQLSDLIVFTFYVTNDLNLHCYILLFIEEYINIENSLGTKSDTDLGMKKLDLCVKIKMKYVKKQHRSLYE